MNAVVQVLALLTAAIHTVVFVWESLLFERPAIHRGIFAVPTEDVPPVRLWSFCVGFYNLFLAAAPVTGVILLHAGHQDAGKVLIIYAAVFMVLSSLVLLVAIQRGLSRPRGTGISGVFGQGLPALGVLVAALF